MHQIQYEDYDYTENKKDVQSYWDRVSERHSDSHNGLIRPIQWEDRRFKTYDDAYEWIENHYIGDYQQIAFSYIDTSSLKKPKKLTTLEERIERLRNDYYKSSDKFHYADVKSKFIGCRHCQSKLNLAHLHRNRCPVCGQDLRPKSTLDQLEYKRNKIEELEKQLRDEERKLAEKYNSPKYLRWLVKIEYHC